MHSAPDPVPVFQRYSWPKPVPALSPEGRRISDEFMRIWHEILPKNYGIIEQFNHRYPTKILPRGNFRTIEIGAGIGGHLEFENLSRQEYHCIELRENMIDEIRKRHPEVTAVQADCQERLPYSDDFFDRAVVVHVLEHLPNLPAAIDELRRVLKPGGILAVVIPCDPGPLYGLARKISAERVFRKHFNMPYEWFIRREHINNPAEIFSVLSSGFREIDRTYFPLRIPSIAANLVIGATYLRA